MSPMSLSLHLQQCPAYLVRLTLMVFEIGGKWPCVGVYRRRSFMSSSLLLQQCPACIVHFTWIVFEIGSKWLCVGVH